MTVKDIFALRKQGKIEEAYEAIRPIYREHKGKYTTLCMFWTASDMLKTPLMAVGVCQLGLFGSTVRGENTPKVWRLGPVSVDVFEELSDGPACSRTLTRSVLTARLW